MSINLTAEAKFKIVFGSYLEINSSRNYVPPQFMHITGKCVYECVFCVLDTTAVLLS